MRILTQSASLSYSPYPALPAPKIAGLLCAPRIAGLLPAHVGAAACPAQEPLRPSRVEVIRPPRTHAELLALLGPIRSRDEMNAELLAILQPHPASLRSAPLSEFGEGLGVRSLRLP